MPVTFSFGGAGNQFPFLMGLAHGLRTHFALDWSKVHVHCISSGCSGAVALLLCTPSEIDELMTRGIYASQHTPHHPSEVYYRSMIKAMLPYDAYRLLEGRLVVGQTCPSTMKPLFTSGPYQTRQELVDTMYSSCRIPFITGGLGDVIDGGFSHQYAFYDKNTIVMTLKRKKASDLYLKKFTFFSEILFVNGTEMRLLYEKGKQVVSENLDMLRLKIVSGLTDETEAGVVFRV